MKYTASANSSVVLLVTTVNPKRLGVFLTCLRKQGTLPSVQCHPHMCFMDYDVQPTIDYFNWLGSNPETEKLVNAEEVTKARLRY
ncbi:hypothetical protein F2Q68_00044239 [Brassica cretica]|uniref:Uncharacterized protein n=1 Tax=Brassica cretica TaxID=69181 RepID=A0A8S9LP55_BRACR|nr:hypothetical protein F2Q68_00044239 [Brassica cretica]